MAKEVNLFELNQMYGDNFKRLGKTSSALGWKSQMEQKLRFEMLCKVIEPNKKSFSVNDYGCGFADLYGYLLVNHSSEVSEYFGYEINEEILSIARQNLISQEAKFQLFDSIDIGTLSDFTIVSGTFNVKLDVPEKEWEDFIVAKLREIDKCSKVGFSFNLLSSYVDWKETQLYYGDPSFYFDLCKREFSRYVSLIHDYPLYEWTICVRKDN